MDEIISFSVERERHGTVVGREDVLKELHRATTLGAARSDRGWVLVKAGMGIGKSAILSAFLTELEQKRGEGGVSGRVGDEGRSAVRSGTIEPVLTQIPHHFIRRGHQSFDRPEIIVRSLAAQIERVYPEQADPKAEETGRLRTLLQRVSERTLRPAQRRLVLIVDGLDEAATAVQTGTSPNNPLPQFLPYELPYGVFVVCASRPLYPHLGWLEEKTGLVSINLDDARWSGSNVAASRVFWERESHTFVPPLLPEFVANAVKQGGGNLLYAIKLRDWLLDQPPESRRAIKLPKGLDAFITMMWEQLRQTSGPGYERVVEGLGVIAAAFESLTLSEVAEVLGWDGLGVQEEFLRCASHFLLEEPGYWRDGIGGDGGHAQASYRPHHESIREFIENKLRGKLLRGFHARLAGTLGAWPTAAGASGFARRYVLRHRLHHLLAAQDWPAVRASCTDLRYLEEACKAGGVAALENQLREAGQLAPAESGGEEISAIAAAVRLESHWLRSDPAAVGALVHNRLLEAGWTKDRVKSTVRPWPSGPLLRHPVRLGGNETRTLWGHHGTVLAMALSHDNGFAISGSVDKTLKIWDLQTGAEKFTLKGHDSAVLAVAISHDGRFAISGSHDKTLKVWDLQTGAESFTLRGHDGPVNAVALSRDGQFAVSGSDDKTLKVWDLQTRAKRCTLSGHYQSVNAVALSHDGRFAVSGSDGETLRVWDLQTGAKKFTLLGHDGRISAVALSYDDRVAVSGSPVNALQTWDLQSGVNGYIRPEESDHLGVVYPLAFSPDGCFAISQSKGNTLRIIDLQGDSQPRALSGHVGWVNAAALSDGGRLAVMGSGFEIKVWDLQSGVEPRGLSVDDDVEAVALSPGGRFAVTTGSRNTKLKVWDLQSNAEPRAVSGNVDAASLLALSPDGRFVVWGGGKTLWIWDVQGGTQPRTLSGQGRWVNAVALSPDGRFAVSGSGGDTFQVWDLQSGTEPRAVSGNVDAASLLALSPDGRFAVSSDSFAGSLTIWDLNGGTQPRTFNGRGSRVTALTISLDSRFAVWGSTDKTLNVWDLHGGAEPRTLNGHNDMTKILTVSPDGRFAVSSSYGPELNVWDLHGSTLPFVLSGHIGRVTALAISPDSLFAVSGSIDKTLKVWDLQERCCAWTVYGPKLLCVAITLRTIVAGDVKGNLWILDLPIGPGATVQTASSTATGSPSGAPEAHLTVESRLSVDGVSPGKIDPRSATVGRRKKSSALPSKLPDPPFPFDQPEAADYAACGGLGGLDIETFDEISGLVLNGEINSVKIAHLGASLRQILVYSTLLDVPEQRGYYRLVGMLALAKGDLAPPSTREAGNGFLRPLDLVEKGEPLSPNQDSEFERIYKIAEHIGVINPGETLVYNTVCLGYRKAYKEIHVLGKKRRSKPGRKS